MSQWRSQLPSAFLATAMQPINTVFIRWLKPDKRDSWDFKVVEKFYNVTKIFCSWDKFITPCLLACIREFIHTWHRNTTLGLRLCMVLQCCVWINSHIRVSKQGGTNSLIIQIYILHYDTHYIHGGFSIRQSDNSNIPVIMIHTWYSAVSLLHSLIVSLFFKILIIDTQELTEETGCLFSSQSAICRTIFAFAQWAILCYTALCYSKEIICT